MRESFNKEKAHDCLINWGGSAKVKESGLAVELLNNSQTKDSQVGNIICDDHATTMCKIKDSLAFAVTKHNDINPAKKGIGNDLYALQKSYKVLSTKVSTYIQKCYSYALAQNKDDTVGTETAMVNGVDFS